MKIYSFRTRSFYSGGHLIYIDNSNRVFITNKSTTNLYDVQLPKRWEYISVN